jgi:hypothetical protein
MGIPNAESLLTRAVLALSTGTGTLRSRMVDACTYSLTHAEPDAREGDYMPEDMYQRLKLLVDRMTTEVTFADTAAAMNDEDAQQWATDLTQLAFEVARFDAEGQSR